MSEQNEKEDLFFLEGEEEQDDDVEDNRTDSGSSSGGSRSNSIRSEGDEGELVFSSQQWPQSYRYILQCSSTTSIRSCKYVHIYTYVSMYVHMGVRLHVYINCLSYFPIRENSRRCTSNNSLVFIFSWENLFFIYYKKGSFDIT